MAWNIHGTIAQDGDLAQLVGLRHKQFIIKLKTGGVFQTHRGVLKHDELIGKPWGSQVFSHNGSPFFLLQPALGDILRNLPRTTQILYPKEIGYILVNMGIGPGMHVVEAGCGSGALTSAFAYAVGDEGHVYTYDSRAESVETTRKNLERLGLDHRVTVEQHDISEGFPYQGADALFLDVANSYDYIGQVRQTLKLGGFFGGILPTTNQVTKLVAALRQNDFAFVDVVEILLRFYKAEPDRFRPVDRMVAHTGYLIFGRPIEMANTEGEGNQLLEETLSSPED